MNHKLSVALLICPVAALTGCKTLGGGHEGARIRIALTKSPIAYLPVYLARELGYFRAEGLEVVIDDFSGATKPMQSLLAGSADVAAITYEQLLPTVAHGQSLKAFYLIQQFRTQALVASPLGSNRVRSVGDLRGQTVGVSSLGGPNHTALLVILAKAGIPVSEVKVVAVGTMASLIAALEHGSAAAAIVNSSEFNVLRARHPEARVLFDGMGPQGTQRLCGSPVCPTAVLAATQQWLERNQGTARKLAVAVRRTIEWTQQHTAEDVRQRMPQTYRMEPAEADVAAVRLVIPGFSRDGKMPPDGAEVIRRFVLTAHDDPAVANLDLGRTYDNSLVGER